MSIDVRVGGSVVRGGAVATQNLGSVDMYLSKTSHLFNYYSGKTWFDPKYTLARMPMTGPIQVYVKIDDSLVYQTIGLYEVVAFVHVLWSNCISKVDISIITRTRCYEMYSNEITNKHANSKYVYLSVVSPSHGC